MELKKKKKTKILDADYRYLNSFLVQQNVKKHFDHPLNYSRPWDKHCTAVYLGNYHNIKFKDSFLRLKADRNIASRLIHKNKPEFHFNPPFNIRVIARTFKSDLALYCPAWAFPVDDKGGKFVHEFDVVEMLRDDVVFTAWFEGSDYGYKSAIKHQYYRKYINPEKWHEYWMKVTFDRVVWYVRKPNWPFFIPLAWKKVTVQDVLFYLRVSIIMGDTIRAEYPADATMDISRILIYK